MEEEIDDSYEMDDDIGWDQSWRIRKASIKLASLYLKD